MTLLTSLVTSAVLQPRSRCCEEGQDGSRFCIQFEGNGRPGVGMSLAESKPFLSSLVLGDLAQTRSLVSSEPTQWPRDNEQASSCRLLPTLAGGGSRMSLSGSREFCRAVTSQPPRARLLSREKGRQGILWQAPWR